MPVTSVCKLLTTNCKTEVLNQCKKKRKKSWVLIISTSINMLQVETCTWIEFYLSSCFGWLKSMFVCLHLACCSDSLQSFTLYLCKKIVTDGQVNTLLFILATTTSWNHLHLLVPSFFSCSEQQQSGMTSLRLIDSSFCVWGTAPPNSCHNKLILWYIVWLLLMDWVSTIIKASLALFSLTAAGVVKVLCGLFFFSFVSAIWEKPA